MKILLFALLLSAPLFAQMALAEEPATTGKLISEGALRRLSAAIYTDILWRAESNGHRFTAGLIANGYRRHLEELRQQFVDAGYTILVECGPLQPPACVECTCGQAAEAAGAE